MQWLTREHVRQERGVEFPVLHPRKVNPVSSKHVSSWVRVLVCQGFVCFLLFTFIPNSLSLWSKKKKTPFYRIEKENAILRNDVSRLPHNTHGSIIHVRKSYTRIRKTFVKVKVGLTRIVLRTTKLRLLIIIFLLPTSVLHGQ